MTASVSQILTEVQGLVTLAVPGTAYFFGARNLRSNGVPPQVVWVPVKSGFGPPEKSVRTARQLWTKFTRIEAHLWAASFDAVDALETAVIQAVHKAAAGSYALEESDPDPPDWLTNGE